MPSCNHLPLEIWGVILYWLCISIAADFKALQDLNSLSDEELEKLPKFRDTPSIKWPATPSCLRSFTSVLRTCRHFHDVIKNGIKLDGRSPKEVLLAIQYQNLDEILKREWNRLRIDDVSFISVARLYSAAGCFWRNEKVLTDQSLLPNILLLSSPDSRRMLIPHLQPWLLSKAIPYLRSTLKVIDIRFSGTRTTEIEWERFVGLYAGNWVVLAGDFEYHSVGGILAPADLHEDELFPALKDIRDSPPDSWWLFPDPRGWYQLTLDGDYQARWNLVSYEQRKIYSAPHAMFCHIWDADNIWEVDKWRIEAKDS
jgi:hypothetical protein